MSYTSPNGNPFLRDRRTESISERMTFNDGFLNSFEPVGGAGGALRSAAKGFVAGAILGTLARTRRRA